MSIEVKVPGLPESVADATVAACHKKVGDTVSRDENLLDLETDKVVLEVPSPVDGVIKEILCETGKVVKSGDLLLRIEEGKAQVSSAQKQPEASTVADEKAGPSARRMMAEHEVQTHQVKGTGKDGRILKEDVASAVHKASDASEPSQKNTTRPAAREERRVPMSRLRAVVAERLLQAQHNAAMLTTFNEVNLKNVIELRTQYKDVFEKKHGVKLGFMSFFVAAVVASLKRFPAVNASIDKQDIIYHGYYDIGIAVSTERGLVVPVIRDADQKSLAEVELAISDFAIRARQGRLTLEEMQGGTFTITNGGVFGSLLATPIINPPQTGILGMHKIEERPIVEKGEIVIRPMMYLALSYDHRLIDGKDSVQFLVSVKELLEEPSRLLLQV